MKNVPKKIVVVGSIVKDEIRSNEGHKAFSYGGITYTVLAFSRLFPRIKVVPIAYIGKKDLDEYISLLPPEVEKDWIIPYDGETNTNLLIYKGENRIEYFKRRTPPVELKFLLEHDDADAFLINFIKNNDLQIKDLKRFSRIYGGIIYVDVHSLVKVAGRDGRSRLRKFNSWQSFSSSVDIIQMNEEEARYFTGIDANTIEELGKLAILILKSGPKVVNITLGSSGSIVAWKDDKEHVEHFLPPRVEIIDPTGCGDVYGASFLGEFLRNGDPRRAAFLANQRAAMNATVMGLGLQKA